MINDMGHYSISSIGELKSYGGTVLEVSPRKLVEELMVDAVTRAEYEMLEKLVRLRKMVS